MFLSWSTLIALTLLAVQNCVGDTSCVLWSSSGPVVQRGSSFVVYCNFKCKCKGSMYSNHPPTPQEHKQFNSTTIYLNVTNLIGKQTYSCRCSPHDQSRAHLLDPCGLDISAGYPPDPPKIVSCIYEIKNSDGGVVKCSWDRGRDTHLLDHFVLRVRTVSGNHTEDPVLYSVSKSQESFTLSRSVQSIWVQVQTQNTLGSAESSLVNYTISDIVRPSTPVLEQPECSSRNCIVKVEQPVKIQHLQIQFRAEQQQQWATHPDSVLLTSSLQAQNISSLEPYRSYVFRARSRFSTGLWSSWSSSVSSWTEEEAPAQAPDVWFTLVPDSKFMKIYWKETNTPISKGRILDYRVRVHSRNGKAVTNVSADVWGHSFPFCADCNMTVWARNSKGLSPPATITTHRTKAKTLQDVRAEAVNSTVAISWKKPEAAPAEYVVEWYPEGLMLEELQWVKLDKKDTCTVLTGMRPWECYEGAVYTFYNKSSVSRTKFNRVATLESAPKRGPYVQRKEKGDKVVITWSELPREERMGCITEYTVHLECHNNNQTHRSFHRVRASERTYTIKDLSPGRYSLWMSASTAKGEGPAGQKIKFYIQASVAENTQLPLLMCVFAALMVLFPCCLWKSSVRFRKYFHCFIPDVVPDPANSKWAKECTKEKGKMNLLFPSGSSSLTSKEDETILVNVEELSKQICDPYIPTNVEKPPPTSLSPDTEQTLLLYPSLPYIKSLSHDSDSSDLTQTSEDTTVDYITSQPEQLDTYDQEDEEELVHFVPSLNIFIDPLEFGGKLTLDAVKIDCSDFFQNTYCESET